jgi:hypothetical protein
LGANRFAGLRIKEVEGFAFRTELFHAGQLFADVFPPRHRPTPTLSRPCKRTFRWLATMASRSGARSKLDSRGGSPSGRLSRCRGAGGAALTPRSQSTNIERRRIGMPQRPFIVSSLSVPIKRRGRDEKSPGRQANAGYSKRSKASLSAGPAVAASRVP